MPVVLFWSGHFASAAWSLGSIASELGIELDDAWAAQEFRQRELKTVVELYQICREIQHLHGYRGSESFPVDLTLIVSVIQIRIPIFVDGVDYIL